MLQKFLILVLFFIGTSGTAYADVSITIRNGETEIFSGSVPFPAEGTAELADNGGTARSVNARSVLSAINDADASSEDFSISNLEYFSSFGSLYLKCIESQTGENCDNWQYTVNDSYPGIGMDQKILSDGDEVYLYFGSQYRVILSAEEAKTTDQVTVTAEEYDYRDNSWVKRTGVTAGITQPNPNDPFSPIEIQTALVDENGQAFFSSLPAGNYNVGIKDDFYFPTAALNVTPFSSSSSSSSSSPSSSGGGGTSKSGREEKADAEFSIEKAAAFLEAKQKEDGSFGEEIYTDWAAIALASLEGENQKGNALIKAVKYLSESSIPDARLTDYERRAMALMALGLNPYRAGGENYIEKITGSFKDGQFGDPGQDNDDIFALIVLSNAGFGSSEKIISDTASFLLARQKENGSWDNSTDMTGAAIQALASLDADEQVKNSLDRARNFLEKIHEEKKDGGFGNISSTAWAMGGINALGENPKDWVRKYKNPFGYLGAKQDSDGGIEGEYEQNRIWETAYAVAGASGKTWNEILQDFEKPAPTITLKEKEELEEKLERVLALLEKQKTQKIIYAPAAALGNPAQNSEKLGIAGKIEGLTQNNTASALNAFGEKTGNSAKKGWLYILLSKIFGF